MKHLYLFGTLLLSFIGYSQTIGIELFASGFTNPVEITNMGDSRLFVVQQGGQVRILNSNGTIEPTPFLDLSSVISTGGERGLLGLAFHPNYTSNGFVYVNYTNTAGNTVIARYTMNLTDAEVVSPTDIQILLTITQPFSNHNGGTIKFGPDGYLYIGMGDGGSSGDPGNRAQNKDVLLGKMLRIDVDGASPYGIPATNPYVGIDGADEIWAIGLRNPWKFSFDNTTGDLWIADVGQGEVEEVNKVPSTTAGLNYGWKCYEGNNIYTVGCAITGANYTFPLTQYTHSQTGGCSITGGYVYRGATYPNFQGKYFFSDYCLDKIGMVDQLGATTYSALLSSDNGLGFTSFGINSSNELYIASINTGTIYKVIDTSLGVDAFSKNSFSLYPNPATNIVSLKTTNSTYPLYVTVMDMAGKKLLGNKLQTETATINVEGLQSGLYMVTVEDQSGSRSTSKLMVN